MDVAGPERRVERLAVHPGEHEDLAVAGVADDGGHEPVRAEPDRRAGRSRRDRPDRQPGAAIAAFTSAIEWMPAVEDRGREHGRGATVDDRRHEVGRRGGPAGRDHGHRDPRR